MQKIIAFLLRVFRTTPMYPFNALESPIDSRNIQLASIQTPVALPDSYETDMPVVELQVGGICVAEAIHKVKELYLKQKGIDINLSPEDLYAQCKLIDGIPNLQGTYPTIGAKVACNTGICSVDAFTSKNIDNIVASRFKYKLGGYAFVTADFNSVCQAIFQNKACIASFSIDSNWFIKIISKVVTSIGRHAVVLHGFNRTNKTVIGQNSWGSAWFGYIAGKLNTNIKPGHFEMLWSDYSDNNVSDIIVFTDIPDAVIQNVKAQAYQFITTMRFGSTGYEVQKLQERFGLKADGIFGNATRNAVITYQSIHGLSTDGVVGPAVRDVLNGTVSVKTKIDLWIEGITSMEGAKAIRNNPGNLRFIGQQYAVNDNGFCKFDTFQHGYDALKNKLIDACTGKSKVYHPEDTLYDFFAKYAPSSDGNNPKHYAEVVATHIRVTPDTQIKALLG